MKEIQEAVQPDNTTLIIDATQGQAVLDQAKAFHGGSTVIRYDGSREGVGGGKGFTCVFLFASKSGDDDDIVPGWGRRI